MSGLDPFWQMIDAQLTELCSARGAADVIRILASERASGDAAFLGSGGDGTVFDSLTRAGWTVMWIEAHYHYAMRAPDGSCITYVEGDIYEGDWRQR